MNSDKQIDPSGVPDAGPAAPRSASRRRLLQAGLGASPAVLTFVSRPVVAAGACASASATISAGSPGRAGVVVNQCAGAGPVTWAATANSDMTAKTTTFSSNVGTYVASVDTTTTDKKGVTKTSTAVYNDPTVAQVLLSSGTTPKDVLARSMAAAYMNWSTNKVPAAPPSARAGRVPTPAPACPPGPIHRVRRRC